MEAEKAKKIERTKKFRRSTAYVVLETLLEKKQEY